MAIAERFVTAVDKQAAKASPEGLNPRRWLSFFTWDAITEMALCEPYGFMEQGDDLCPTEGANGDPKEIHAMDAFHGAQAFNSFVLHTPDWQMFLGRSLFRLPGAQKVE